jgi:hypothetical protein
MTHLHRAPKRFPSSVVRQDAEVNDVSIENVALRRRAVDDFGFHRCFIHRTERLPSDAIGSDPMFSNACERMYVWTMRNIGFVFLIKQAGFCCPPLKGPFK